MARQIIKAPPRHEWEREIASQLHRPYRTPTQLVSYTRDEGMAEALQLEDRAEVIVTRPAWAFIIFIAALTLAAGVWATVA